MSATIIAGEGTRRLRALINTSSWIVRRSYGCIRLPPTRRKVGTSRVFFARPARCPRLGRHRHGGRRAAHDPRGVRRPRRVSPDGGSTRRGTVPPRGDRRGDRDDHAAAREGRRVRAPARDGAAGLPRPCRTLPPSHPLERLRRDDRAGARARRRVGLEVVANRLDPGPTAGAPSGGTRRLCAVCGERVQARVARRDSPVVYVGDGYSDRCAALAADRVFARDGLAEYLATSGIPSSPSRPSTTLLLRFPEPYDFELSTERFRAFGPDLANLWHEGGLHRVVGGREVRIEAAPGGVDVEPLDDGHRAGRREAAGRSSSTSSRSPRGRRREPCSHELVPRLAGFRPPLAPDPFEALVTSITAQQVSLFSAFAIRNRLIERSASAAGTRTRSRPASGSPARPRTSSSRSGSRAARPSTSSASRAPTSTSTRSPRSPTTR